MNVDAGPVAPSLTLADRRALRRLARLFRGAAPTSRERRLQFLALAAPGFAGVFATPLHRSLVLMILGGLLFAAAIIFRARTEPLFVRAEAVGLWPPFPKETLND